MAGENSYKLPGWFNNLLQRAPNLSYVGTITHGTWNAATIGSSYGGTGVTLLGNITKTDDTNVTLTLGGTPNGSVITSTSFTLGWTGQLAASRGGTGLSSLGTGIATWLGTPSSANLASAITDETGSGALVFATSPTLVTPALGTVASGVISACTSTSMVMVTPVLGTPTSGTLTNCTGYTEANLSITDITTNNVSTSKHGFAPKGDGSTTKFLNANGAYSTPTGGGTVNSGTANHLAYYASSTTAVSDFLPHSFQAIPSGATTIAANGFTKITFGTVEFNVGGDFDNTTNYRFTPTVAGIYRVTGEVQLNGTNVTVTNRYITCLYKNGSLYKTGNEGAAIATTAYGSQVNCLVSLNGSTDYIEIYFYNNNAATTVTNDGDPATHFSANWVGPLA